MQSMYKELRELREFKSRVTYGAYGVLLGICGAIFGYTFFIFITGA